MEKILLVEDTDSLREVLKSVLESEGFTVDAFSNAENAIESIKRSKYSCILSDFKLPQKNGIELLQATREISRHVPFLIMTAYGSIEIAVEAMKEGANDFITKPFEPDYLITVIKEVLKHNRIFDRNTLGRSRHERPFLTKNPAVLEVLKQVNKVSKVDTSVLILGESGTGKELIARSIHQNSPRKDKPFIAVNCAAMPAELLESEFFGHEAGSFTGATQTRLGVFEVASEGTIFLDEIGDMPLQLQVKCLRALQEREIKRVGGNRNIKINPRIIAATNHNIEEALAVGTLREDFYYRLAVISFNMLPLRDRREDIDILVEHYLDVFSKEMGKEGVNISKEATKTLKTYHWPGNARELENVLERAVILADREICNEHLGINIDINLQAIEDAAVTLHEISGKAAKRAEVDLISKTLNRTMGNKSKAAQILGVSYKTLLNKLKEYGIEFEARV
jgi:DNA-binding NtrC family response regulator